MSVSGIGTAGYPAAGYETRKTQRAFFTAFATAAFSTVSSKLPFPLSFKWEVYAYISAVSQFFGSTLETSIIRSVTAGKNNPVSFQAVLDVNMGGLEDRLKAQYPNLKYHVLVETSIIRSVTFPFLSHVFTL